ncbi:RagB/SusD family nutrient uptake outer membrane protein [uncultured Bacteroides sp.]|uniref:RagB/SusD family nutrient uptake outer membrane protein n=1 Tax=uncultured Bacteroides sp. TaxID=162156 RepID=UPI0025D9BA43|nr:RagB/SusD family nutrient uptake outer membrane protein [uncultured Bacteroides sp.]
MKIINTIKAMLLLSAVIILPSCLDLEPKDQLADANIWQTPNDYKLYANQFYEWTRDFSSAVYDGPHSDTRSDLMTSSDYNEFSKGVNTIPVSDGNYTGAYTKIRYANILLQNAESYANPADIARYVAEAKFFRAYEYFDLLQLFGDVIIVAKPVDIHSPEMNAVRNDRSEVVDFIIQDLKDAIPDLPKESSIASADKGRVSQGAAQAFLSRVALYEGTWQKFRTGSEARVNELLDIAAGAAWDVIDSKQYEIFKPAGLETTAYKYLFILENTQSNPVYVKKDKNQEYIFSRRHDEVIAPIGKNITKNCFANVQWITRKLAEMYLDKDGLPIHNPNSVVGAALDYSSPQQEYENRDNRMTNTLMVPGNKYWNNNAPHTTWTDADKAAFDNKPFYPTSGSGYYNQKWATEREVKDTYEGYDYPIIRYAEVLLNYAEAVYERYSQKDAAGTITDASKVDAALKYLNQVRKRVNPDMPELTVAFATAKGLNMRDEIRRERTVELFNEGFRVDDLKRWKQAEIEMPKDILGVRWSTSGEWSTWANAWKPSYATATDDAGTTGCFMIETGRVWDNKNYLYPIPSDQKQLNPNIGQNPDW